MAAEEAEDWVVVLHPLGPVLAPVVSGEVCGADGEESGHGEAFGFVGLVGSVPDGDVVALEAPGGG